MANTWVSQPELVAILGEEATSEILRTLGGQVVYVPKCGPLVDAIGGPAMKALCEQFAGMTLALPACGSSKKERVIELLEAGLRPAAVAREVRVSERWVRQVKSDVQPTSTRA